MVVDTVFFVDAQHFTAERNHLLIALFFGELQKCTLWLALRGGRKTSSVPRSRLTQNAIEVVHEVIAQQR